MAELKDNQLVFVDDKGNEVVCDIIFTYDSEEFKKSYVFFSPVGSADEDGRVEVSCASYVPQNDGIGELSEVTDEKEWEMLGEVFEKFSEEYEDEECGCGCGCCDCEGECDCECDCEEDEECECGHCHCHDEK